VRILLVEDDHDLAQITARRLKKDGLVVDIAENGTEAQKLIASVSYDLLILDLILPDSHGFDILRFTRQTSPLVPVIALTAKDKEEDIISGLKHGFDDYLVKPFSYRELFARISVLIRSTPTPPIKKLVFPDLEIQPLTHQVTSKGKPIKLSAHEYRLLLVLAQNHNQPLTANHILQTVWGLDNSPKKGRLLTTISRLRKKLGDTKKTIIQTKNNSYKLSTKDL